MVSLFEQDFEDIEYIFVNDCTPDKSIEILESVIERYPNRKPYCKIIHHEVNKGLGCSRRTGFLNSTGKYVIHIDSDDWCDLDMISIMYEKSEKENLDILIADIYVEFENRSLYGKQNPIGDVLLNLISRNCLAVGVWNKFIKRSLYTDNNVLPPEYVSYEEDAILTITLAFYAQKIGFIGKAFYHYRKNNINALTYKITKNKLNDSKFFIKYLEEFLIKNNIYDKYQDGFKHLFIKHHYNFFYDYRDQFLYKNYNSLITLYDVLGLDKKTGLPLYEKLFRILIKKKYKKERSILLFHIKCKFKYLIFSK